MSNWLEMFASRAFPNAAVYRLPHCDAYRVSIEVDARDLIAQRDATLRRVVTDLRPRFAPRRRLHWGKRK